MKTEHETTMKLYVMKCAIKKIRKKESIRKK